MLSGNGRHRRPRQAPALLVAAGVTGSAIAIPLLGAASANAADGTTWDKVAECESGGSWSADSGNGYYGGLQMSQDDWDKYGGLAYASSPDEASRSQQIAVAEKVLADQGTKPWATCALLSGLTASSGSVDVDTGVSASDSPGSSDSSDSSDSSSSSGLSDSQSKSDSSGKASPSANTDEESGAEGKDKGKSESKGEDSANSDKSESGDSGNPQGSGGTPTEVPKTDNPDNSWQSGGSWSLVDTGAIGGGRHRGGNADESAVNGQESASSGRHASRTYTVRDGDTLASIADSLDVDGGWRALYAANKAAIGADPNDITPGQTLDVATETGGK
ncbi:transglycosylase family protein [Streptomyces sp. NPDC050625]|uniref:transglycosylase family protein n=1 Tax=Streptomyces sp. NPDC050625 TaxID=3154629 RepID=UPI00343E87E7